MSGATTENQAKDGIRIRLSGRGHACMRHAGRPLLRVLEHGLPQAKQTHEMIVHTGTKSVFATQMEEGRLVKLKYEETGKLNCEADWVLMDLAPASGDADPETTPPKPSNGVTSPKDDERFVGAHGLSHSYLFPDKLWLTLQYINKICLVNAETLEVEATIDCPRTFEDEIVGGPHCVLEGKDGRLYICLKGGASCHGEVADIREAEEATTHAIFRVDINKETGEAIPGSQILFPVAPTVSFSTTQNQKKNTNLPVLFVFVF